MYGQSTYRRANSRLASIDSRRVVGIADDQPADDVHAVAVQMLDRLDAGVADRPAVLAAARSSRVP